MTSPKEVFLQLKFNCEEMVCVLVGVCEGGRRGEWRPIIDLSCLHQFVLCPHFKMETLETIRLTQQKGD